MFPIIGESGVKWDKKMALSDTRKISNLRKIFLFYILEHVLIYFVEFFHVFVLLMLAAIELIKISKIFRNRTKRGVRVDRLCPKLDKCHFIKNNNN